MNTLNQTVNGSAIRAVWAYAHTPYLSRIKAEGRLEEARETILDAAAQGLKRAYPNGDAPLLDYANALECAARDWFMIHLKETA